MKQACKHASEGRLHREYAHGTWPELTGGKDGRSRYAEGDGYGVRLEETGKRAICWRMVNANGVGERRLRWNRDWRLETGWGWQTGRRLSGVKTEPRL